MHVSRASAGTFCCRRSIELKDGAGIAAVARSTGRGAVIRGTDNADASLHLPSVLHSTIAAFGSVENVWFWGLSDVADREEHMARAEWTIRRLTVPLAQRGDVVNTAQRFVAAFRAADFTTARRIWADAFFTRLRADLVTTSDVITHLRTYYNYILPATLGGVVYKMLPWTYYTAFKPAKEALIAWFGTDALGTRELCHHAMAITAGYEVVLQKALTEREGEIRAAQASGGFPVLKLFDGTTQMVFRVGTGDTTAGGVLPPGAEMKRNSIAKMEVAGQSLREHRFLMCCAQNLLVELVREIVDQYYDRQYTILACRAPVPVEDRVIPDRLRAAQEEGRWDLPDGVRYVPAVPAAAAAAGDVVIDTAAATEGQAAAEA